MANTFKNKITPSIGTAVTTVYTAPATTTTTVIGMSVANRTGAAITVSVELFDTSAGGPAYLVLNAPVAVGGALVAIGGDQKMVLETGDYLRVTSSAASSADVIVSVLEIA